MNLGGNLGVNLGDKPIEFGYTNSVELDEHKSYNNEHRKTNETRPHPPMSPPGLQR